MSILKDLILNPGNTQKIIVSQTSNQDQNVDVNPNINITVDITDLQKSLTEQTNFLKLNSFLMLNEYQEKIIETEKKENFGKYFFPLLFIFIGFIIWKKYV